MNSNGATYSRVFRVGDPGIPEEGVIIGRGGGFTQIYDDFVLLPDRMIRFMTYMTEGDSPTIPEDYESARLLFSEAVTFQDAVRRLDEIKFRSIELPPPGSDAFEYIVLIEKAKGVHAVIWAPGRPDSIPSELLVLVRSLRACIAVDFVTAYGRS